MTYEGQVRTASLKAIEPMKPALSILAPTRYVWRFSSPRSSRHRIENRDFVPFNRIWRPIEGVTFFNPWPPRRFDLIHAFNRIPVTTLPFVIGFESHLPRAFGHEGGPWWRWMTDRLASDQCRGIVAISEFARNLFLQQHAAAPDVSAVLTAKLHLRYPNIVLPDLPDPERPRAANEIRLAFVGGHFARKGGCVAVVMADLARHRGFPLVVDIVSTLEMGASIWTDPADPAALEPYIALLDRPNVRLHRGMPNDDVLALLRQADMSLLATFCDTFGFSAVESLANGTPVIVTRQGALPELVTDGVNGIVLDLPTKPPGEWIHLDAPDRAAPAFIRMWHDEIRRLAEEALDALIAATATAPRRAAMRLAARRSVERFCARRAAAWWDEFYDAAHERVVAADWRARAMLADRRGADGPRPRALPGRLRERAQESGSPT